MNIVNTNVLGLSNAWADAIKFLDNEYSSEYKGWRTTTGLVKPVKAALLSERHADDIIEDITDRANTMVGSACHDLMARAAPEGAFVEQRFTINCLGKEIGIKPDRVDPIACTDPEEYRLIEFKFASAWSIMLGDKDEWTKQCNINTYALRQIGINVTEAVNEVKITDWAYREAVKNREYPKYPIALVQVNLWPEEKIKDYLEERVRLYIKSEQLNDDDLPECSHSERWAKADTFAVIKKGGKRAQRVLTTRTEAEQYMQEKGFSINDYNIDYRPGESTRCVRFCPANVYCSQYQKTKKGF